MDVDQLVEKIKQKYGRWVYSLAESTREESERECKAQFERYKIPYFFIGWRPYYPYKFMPGYYWKFHIVLKHSAIPKTGNEERPVRK